MALSTPDLERLIMSAALAAFLAACGTCPPPQRPTGLTSGAHWAGGCDGGVWITCSSDAQESFTAFGCQVHDHPAGALLATGPFALAEVVRARDGSTRFRPQAAAFAEPPAQYLGYDGTAIALPDGRFLVPHGTVDYPAGGDHGRRVEYVMGEARFEETY
jgi:hypothetical protein